MNLRYIAGEMSTIDSSTVSVAAKALQLNVDSISVVLSRKVLNDNIKSGK
jgi:hypothetical protein